MIRFDWTNNENKTKKKPKINIATQVVFRGLYIDIIRYYSLDPANQNSKKETRHQYCNQQMYRFWLWSSLLISQFNFQRKIIHSTFMTFCLHSTKTAQSVEFCFVFWRIWDSGSNQFQHNRVVVCIIGRFCVKIESRNVNTRGMESILILSKIITRFIPLYTFTNDCCCWKNNNIFDMSENSFGKQDKKLILIFSQQTKSLG